MKDQNKAFLFLKIIIKDLRCTINLYFAVNKLLLMLVLCLFLNGITFNSLLDFFKMS